MTSWRPARLVALVLALGCSSGPTTEGVGQGPGLEGQVLRGPVTPTCAPDHPCDLPFAATFHIQQNGIERARFTSDTLGHFAIALAPGSYRIIPDDAAPVMDPGSQAKDVAVGTSGVTRVRLEFDTGIR
jgi:hypothetical protein